MYFKLFRDVNGNGVFDSDTDPCRIESVTERVLNKVIDYSIGFVDRDRDGIYDYWELKHGLSPTNSADAFLDPDNDGLLNLHEYWLDSNPRLYDQTNSVIQLFTKSIDDRLMMNATSNEVALVLPKFSTYEENNFVPNTNFWLRGVDTSSVSMWTDFIPEERYQGPTMFSQRSGVAISKRHILQAHHWPVTNNMHVIFYGTDGVVYTNTVIGSKYVGNDLKVALLAEELPDAVSVMQVMPTNFFNYIGAAERIPFVYLDQNEEARILEIKKINFATKMFTYHGSIYQDVEPTNLIRKPYYKYVIGGDSGSPYFFIAGNIPVLMSVAWHDVDSNFIGFFTHDIQEKMDLLCPGYQLQIFDLSQFSEVKTERVKK